MTGRIGFGSLSHYCDFSSRNIDELKTCFRALREIVEEVNFDCSHIDIMRPAGEMDVFCRTLEAENRRSLPALADLPSKIRSGIESRLAGLFGYNDLYYRESCQRAHLRVEPMDPGIMSSENAYESLRSYCGLPGMTDKGICQDPDDRMRTAIIAVMKGIILGSLFLAIEPSISRLMLHEIQTAISKI